MAFYREGEGITYDFGFGDVNSSRMSGAVNSAVDWARNGLIGPSNRANESYEAQFGMPAPLPGLMTSPSDNVQYQLDNYKPPKVLSKADAEAKVKSTGVKLTVPDNGISEDYLNLLIQRKQDANARALAIDRTPDGVVSGTVNLLAGLVGSMADPTNIAMAFIPVVGEARYASLMAKFGGNAFGRTAVRAGVGAVEGAAGMAMLEPFTAMDKLSNQDEYGIGTAAADIGFGALFGSAMHVGVHAIGRAVGEVRERFGKVEDPNAAINVADRVSPDINEAAFKAKMAADSMGADVNVEPIIKLDPRAEERMTPEQMAARDQFAEDYARQRMAVEDSRGKLDTALEEGRAEWRRLNEQSANAPVQGDIGAVKEAIKESHQPAADRVADFKAAEEANITAKEGARSHELESVKADAEELVRQVKEIEAQRGAEFPEMKAANEAAQRAQTYAQALKAAAICGVKF